MEIFYKNSAQQKRFEKIYKNVYFENKNIKQNAFKDIVIKLDLDFEDEKKLILNYVDNKKIFYNKIKKMLVIQ